MSRLRAIRNAKMAEKRKEIRDEIMAAEQGGMSRKDMGDYILKLQKRVERQDRIIAGMNTQFESLRMFLMYLVQQMGGEVKYSQEEIKKFYEYNELIFTVDGDDVVLSVLMSSKDAVIEAPTAEMVIQ